MDDLMAGTNGVGPFHALEILARAKALEAEGRTIHHLEVGQPGAMTAPAVRLVAAQAIESGPIGYTHSLGAPSLRARIAQHYTDTYGVAVDPGTVVVTTGSSAGFVLAFLGSFARGSRIAVTRPGYPAYVNILKALGFEPVEIALTPSNGWRLEANRVRETFTERPFAGLLLASPANPTGAVVAGEEFAAIVAACAELGVRFISDEIYQGLVHGPAAPTAAGPGSRAIVINSFSKYFCMTGWRIGWMVLPPELVRPVEMLAQSLYISPPGLAQIAAETALGESSYHDGLRDQYRDNLSYLAEQLRPLGFGIDGVPDGAFYLYADVSALTNDSMAFSRKLLEGAGVATTPGIDFDREQGSRYVRLSAAGTRETMDGAVAAIRHFLGEDA